jgi:hypothetical protein
MKDYAWNDRNLRVKKDVSDLKMDSLFWGSVLGKNHFFASCRTDPSAAVPPVRGALSRQLPVKAFSCWDQLLCMAFAQLTFRESLRDIEDCLSARADQLPLRLPQRVCRSTLADADQVRDWRIYADLATQKLRQAA